MTRLFQRIDPRTSDGTEITTANVGTVDGAKFPAARALAMYNESRIALANAISIRLDPFSKRQAVSNNIVRNSTFSFASGNATKETGYVENVSLMNAAGQIISVLPSHLASITRYLDSAVNPIVYEEAGIFHSENGASFVPDAATYIHRYFGISAFVAADVTNGTTNETFSAIWESVILEIAEAIATEQGLAQLNRLALTLVSPGGANAA